LLALVLVDWLRRMEMMLYFVSAKLYCYRVFGRSMAAVFSLNQCYKATHLPELA